MACRENLIIPTTHQNELSRQGYLLYFLLEDWLLVLMSEDASVMEVNFEDCSETMVATAIGFEILTIAVREL